MREHSLWEDAFYRLLKDKIGFVALMVVLFYCLMALMVSVTDFAGSWEKEIASAYSHPSLLNVQQWMGTDIFGRSVFLKVIQGTQVAISVGFVTSIIAIVIGTLMGAIAGYFGGKTDEIIVWIYTTVSSIPDIILLVAIAFVLGKGLWAIYCALGLTMWVHICRLIRAEVIRQKQCEYVQAAYAIGCSHTRRLFVHILPNVMHIVIIQFSLLFQSAVKSEVILSYLGLGVQGHPSWGTMIDDAKLELARGVWWQLASATVAMFCLVLALNILGDSLRDALDPKLKGQ